MPAELGGELVGDELHFLDRLDREPARPELRRALQRQPLRVVVRAVDVGAEVPHFLAADVDRVRAGAGGDDVGVERQQPEVVALLDRQVLERRADRSVLDTSGRGRLHDRRIAGDGDGLLHRRQLQREVQHDVLAGVEDQALAHLGGKAVNLDAGP